MELAERDQVIDAVLAAAEPLGSVGDVQPRCALLRTSRYECGCLLGDLSELLVGEGDGQLDHRAAVIARDLPGGCRCAISIIATYDHDDAKPSNELLRHDRSSTLDNNLPVPRRADPSVRRDRAAGYARYLEGKTVAPERGDYYLSPDGELREAPGRWLSDRHTLGRLGIEGSAPALGEDFVALMEGRDPQTGKWLRPEGAGGGRGGGIDTTFSAPKSVSVVWALGDPWQREQIEQAHANAVA